MQASKDDIPGAIAEVDKVLAQHPNSPEALALKGDLELARGHGKEARELFTKAAAADPQDRNSRARIAAISLQLKEYDAAQKGVDDLKKLTGPAPATMLLQAQIHLAQGKLEPARDAVLAALKYAPDYLPALALSAQIHLGLNSFELAEKHAKRVVDGAPNATIGYRLLGVTYIRMNAPDKALQLLQPALDKGTKDSTLYAIAGEAALRANEPQKAAAYFEQAAKLNPKDSRTVTGLAFASLARGDRERGITELEQASDMENGSAQADYALVMTHLRAREYDKALAAVDKLEKKQPDSALAANLRGSVLAAKGDLPGARKAFELSLKRDPKFFPATANLATLDLRDKKVDAAKKRYTTLLEKDPKNVPAMLALARIEQGTHNVELAEKARADALAGKLPDPDAKRDPRGDKEALEWLKKAREADRTSIPAALALSSWYMGNGQPQDAIPLLQEMLASNADNIQLLDALGTAYLRSDQQVQAMETFEKILRIKPDSAALQLRMGQLKLSRGDTTGAMQNLRKAAELAPKAVEPRAALAAAYMRSGKPDEARKIAAALQKEQPKNAAGLVLEGDIALLERKFGDAAGAYKKALAVEKTVPTSSEASPRTVGRRDVQRSRYRAPGAYQGTAGRPAGTHVCRRIRDRPEALVKCDRTVRSGDCQAAEQRAGAEQLRLGTLRNQGPQGARIRRAGREGRTTVRGRARHAGRDPGRPRRQRPRRQGPQAGRGLRTEGPADPPAPGRSADQDGRQGWRENRTGDRAEGLPDRAAGRQGEGIAGQAVSVSRPNGLRHMPPSPRDPSAIMPGWQTRSKTWWSST